MCFFGSSYLLGRFTLDIYSMKKFFTAFALLAAVLGIGTIPRSVIAATTNPRILLNGEILTAAEKKKTANDSAWVNLKAACDTYATASVEYPDGKAYGDSKLIGLGYQGDGYNEPIFDLGICYQLTKTSDAAAAQKYVTKGIDMLMKISVPAGQAHAYNPLTDSGYGIRNFGVDMAIGYDWFGEAMTAAQKKQVYTSLNYWISEFERKGFGYEHPQGNYFAGYFAAKALTALATSGDNPEAANMWTSWKNKYDTVVQPYYQTWMKGGGWPEGWNYGALATQNMLWPVIAAYTANGVDLTQDTTRPFGFVNDQADNLMHFAWPSLKSLDDAGTVYEGDNPTPTNSALYTFEAFTLRLFKKPTASRFQRYAAATRAVSGPAPLWQEFLLWDSSASSVSYQSEPLSFAGVTQAAMRSSWNTDAVWGSFTAGPYVNYPGSGEASFNQGSLVIVQGNTPFLVNPTGALNRNAVAGKDDPSYGDQIYDDRYGSKKRLLANIFYPGSGQLALSPDLNDLSQAPATRLVNFEDGGSYVAMQGARLEAMYPKNTATNWTRSIVYMRPNIFVIADTTSIPAAHDQFQQFYVAATPKEITSIVAGAHQIRVTNGSGVVGTVTTLLPEMNKVALTNVFSSNKVYRLEVRPGNAGTSQNWLTTFEVGAGQTQQSKLVITGTPGSSGVLLKGVKNTAVVVSGSSTNATLAYAVPAAQTEHIITNLNPNASYAITVSGEVVTVTNGSGFVASGVGVLHFFTQGAAVTTAPNTPPAPTSPPSTDPVPTTPVDVGQVAATRPVYYLYNRIYGLDFYTVNTQERSVLLKNSSVWLDKGIVFKVPVAGKCTNPEIAVVRRLALKNGRGFRYVTGDYEIEALSQGAYRGQYNNNGTVFCGTVLAPSADTVSVYRLDRVRGWNTRFTTSLSEYNRLIHSGSWVGKGIVFFAQKP